MQLKTALAGNPNAGKTTLFNALTGARQHVGNYPGITVEKKVGRYDFGEHQLSIVDLPGTYSLTAYSLEEVVARDFLVDEKPDVVINIVDATNLERNLYLTLQFLEMGVPLCLALNMVDVADSRGISIDVERLSSLLGIPVIPTVARSGEGITELMAAAVEVATGNASAPPLEISYGADVDQALVDLESETLSHGFLTETYPARWTALKYLEKDEQILSKGQKEDPELSSRMQKIVGNVEKHLQETLDSQPEAIIADQRYGYIHAIVKQGVIHQQLDLDRLYASDRIDKVVTNQLVGPLIMVAVVLSLYHFVFSFSEIPVGWCESFFSWLGYAVSGVLAEGPLKSLMVSGVIDGVGGVLGFVPLIMLMFFGISILEDSGYLARVAFMLDKVFSVFGLHGSAVMPFIVSGGIAGGCAVPGVMATRTLKSPRERLATLLTVPFMNCGAKLPVFALLVATFFAQNEAMVMFGITVVAWVGALLVAKLLRTTVIRGPATPFVMELPPYRLPTLKGLCIHTWERTWKYIRKAGTVILGVSILLWAMMTFPGLPESDRQHYDAQRSALTAGASEPAVAQLGSEGVGGELGSAATELREGLRRIDAAEAEARLRFSVAGRIGSALESVTRLSGFDWRTNIALVGGFAAKEVIVSSLGTAYSLGEIDPEDTRSLADKLASMPNWTPLVALSLIVFIIFYSPCFVTLVCIAKEAGSWKWALFSMGFNTLLAFLLAVIIFQVGTIIGY